MRPSFYKKNTRGGGRHFTFNAFIPLFSKGNKGFVQRFDPWPPSKEWNPLGFSPFLIIHLIPWLIVGSLSLCSHTCAFSLLLFTFSTPTFLLVHTLFLSSSAPLFSLFTHFSFHICTLSWCSTTVRKSCERVLKESVQIWKKGGRGRKGKFVNKEKRRAWRTHMCETGEKADSLRPLLL